MIEDYADPALFEKRKRRRAFLRTWGLLAVAAAFAALLLPRLVRSIRPPVPPRAASVGASQSAPSPIPRAVKVEGGYRKTYKAVEENGQIKIVVEEVRQGE